MSTIYTIAKEAKVSPATVSRVLNGWAVKPATKKKIEGIIRETGYTPDSRAQALKSSKSRKIGLIIPDIANPFYPNMVKKIYDNLKQYGYALIQANTYGKLEEEIEILNMMKRERVDGIMVCTVEGENDRKVYSIFENLIASGVAVLFLGKYIHGLKADNLSVDNIDGTRKATEYLLKLRREKIGFIGGALGGRVTTDRITGFKSAFRNAGKIPDEDLIIANGERNIEYGEKHARQLITAHNADAIVCENDLLAIGALNVAEKLNLKVPGDLSVVGFNDNYLATIVKPRLTTVRIPVSEITKASCRRLLNRIDGQLDETEDILFEPELIIRESA